MADYRAVRDEIARLERSGRFELTMQPNHNVRTGDYTVKVRDRNGDNPVEWVERTIEECQALYP